VKEHDMSDLATTIDTYLEAYGEPDGPKRTELIRRVFADDGRLIDPPLDASGHDGIAAMAEAVQSQFPGHRFRRTSAVDAHHDFARYGWELFGPDGAVAVAGMDVVELDTDGRLVRVVGFFGDLGPGDTTAG
jgi:hypothetical protein